MIPWKDFPSGDHRITCPACGRGERDKTLGVTIEDGAGVAHCFRCSYVENWRDSSIRKSHGKAPLRRIQPKKHDGLSDYARDLLRASTGLRGSVGANYLQARGCILPPEDGGLRFHPALKHPTGYVGPALLAIISDCITGEPISLHRTWVSADGTKATDPARLVLKDHRKGGGAIRLWPDEDVTHGLGIAEGIETALSLAVAFRPVWSVIDAGNMAAFPVLPGIECLTIAADHDPAGLAAANECATRWAAVGREVRIVVPPSAGADLNDVLQGTSA